MGFEVFIAKRYLLTRKKTGFISIISVISILGVAVGVAALIIVLSLMNGFSKELRSRLLGMDGHIWVDKPMEGGVADYRAVADSLRTIKNVTGVSPFCSFQTAAWNSGRTHFASVEVRGADLSTVDSVSDINEFIRGGLRLNFNKDKDGVPGIVIGGYLANALGWTEVGGIIYLWGPGDLDEIMETFITPKIYKFRVTGIFDSGFYDYDNAVMLIDIAEAQKIIGLDEKVTGIVVKLTDAFQAPKYADENGLIEQKLGGYPYFSTSWIDRNQILFKWMKLEKWGAFLVLFLIILVATFNIVSTLIMLVMDKTREIGILKSMGASNKMIERIFVYQGIFVGVSGTMLGSISGTLFCYLQDKYQFISFPADIYFISALPMDLQMRDVVAITLVTLFLCWLSSFYPAKKAAELDPVEAIRSE